MSDKGFHAEGQEVKRFVKWCIDNELAFTHIDEAVHAFREGEKDLEDGLATDLARRFKPELCPCGQCNQAWSTP